MIANLWAQLPRIATLTFTARSAHPSGWNGAGRGRVRVEERDAVTLLFHEQGTWRTAAGDELSFSNIFRWTLRREWIRLEHLRFGPENPVFLFAIEARSKVEFASVTPHVCSEDLYSAMLKLNGETLLVSWRVAGPEKDERMDYIYSAKDVTG